MYSICAPFYKRSIFDTPRMLNTFLILFSFGEIRGILLSLLEKKSSTDKTCRALDFRNFLWNRGKFESAVVSGSWFYNILHWRKKAKNLLLITLCRENITSIYGLQLFVFLYTGNHVENFSFVLTYLQYVHTLLYIKAAYFICFPFVWFLDFYHIFANLQYL